MSSGKLYRQIRDLTYKGKNVRKKPRRHIPWRPTAIGISVSGLAVLALSVPSSGISTNRHYRSALTTTWSAVPYHITRVIRSIHPNPFPFTYTVQKGDTLTDIANSVYGRSDAWTLIYFTNKVTDPDTIQVGQRLKMVELKGKPPAPPSMPKASTGASVVQHSISSVPLQSYYGASGSYQACVISRESGGNPRAVNPYSGAGGLYQFLPSTWASLGYSGLPQDASVAEQNAAFQQLYAESGSSPWSSDGC